MNKLPAFSLLLFCLLLAARLPAAPARVTDDFDAHWRFSRGDFAAAMTPAFDDAPWRSLNVPHDWSIEGPFGPDYGSGNGFAPGGIGWYRKHFQLDPAQSGRRVTIEFDGVYDHSEVWINGQFLGARPFGFASFAYDLTPYVKGAGADNVVAVRVDHSRFADSRFYTGSGIYRNVRLVYTDQLHLARWGVLVTIPKISADAAAVRIETTVENAAAETKGFSLQSDLVAPDGTVAASLTTAVPAAPGSVPTLVQTFKIPRPQLWSPATPALYTVTTSVQTGTAIVDDTTTAFGIRTAVFDPDQGFLLNGVVTKIKGVCLHHDAGALGAAVPDRVWERRLRALKEIGVNAIRTSHNPPDPALLDWCDRLGLLVMDEAFDEFTPGKNKWVAGLNTGAPSRFGYAESFAQWSVTDISDMVRRDRNHPGLILWSIGNEVDYANDPFSDPVLGPNYHPENPPAKNLLPCAAPLVAAVKALDPTRPVTAALATVAMSDAVGLPELLDAVGYNYQEGRYAADHARYPHRIIYGSENSQQYDAWRAVETNQFISGQFLWTGIDYLGEAGAWPNRANGAGLLDLCGFKKPVAWFRQSLWSDQPMVYLCANSGGRRGFNAAESWNWPPESTVNVQCYANCPEITLTLNDQVIGTKTPADAINGVLSWRVPFAPGTLRAVGRAQGKDVAEFALQTAGAPARVELRPDTTRLHANGKDVSQVEYRIVDAHGVRVPDADAEVTFELTGPARMLGIGNGDLSNSEPCQGLTHRSYQGRGLAILQAGDTAGPLAFRATAPGLAPAEVTLESR